MELAKIGLTPQGAFNASNAPYEYLDTVTDNGKVYLSKKDNNNDPLTNTLSWEIWVESGEDGVDGTNAQSFIYKDDIDNYAGLPSAGNSVNDAYYNLSDKKLYVFNGTSFPADGNGIILKGEDGANGTAEIPDWVAGNYAEKSLVIKDNSIWRVADGQTAGVGDVPGVSDKWKSLGCDDEDVRKALKWFLEQQSGGTEVLDKTFEISNVASYGNLYGIANNAGKILIKDNTIIPITEAGTYPNVWKNIPTKANGIKKIIAKITPYGNNPANPTNANIVGIKGDGSVIPLVLNPGAPPGVLTTYDLDITEYESISIGMAVIDSNPNTNTQTIEFYKVEGGQSLENSVKDYIDENAGGIISPQFDPTATTEPQGGKQIADWILSNEKPAGASSDFEVVDEWTFNCKSVTGFQSNQYNTKSIQFIDATGVSKLLLTMPTKLTSAEPGDVVYGKKLDGTFQTIYNLPNQNLNDFEVLIPQNTYLHIYVNSYWFTGQNASGHLVKVFRGSGTQEKIYGDAKTVEALAKASKFFIEAGAGEEHTIVAGLSGQYSEGYDIYGSGSYRNILAYPATGVTKIKFTALTAAVSGEQRPRTIYGKKADGSFESIMDFKEQDLVNFEVPIKPNYFTHLYVNYRVGSQPTEIDMIKEVDTTNSIKKFIENNGGGSGISLGNTFISAESAGLSTTKTASENTALLNQLLEDNKSLGGALYFNRGTFTLNDTIQVPNTIQLIGTGRSGTAFTALNGLQNKPMFNVFKVAGGDTNAGINGFTLNGNNIAGRGIQINSPSAFFEYHDFNLWDFTDYAIFSDGGLIFALRNIRIGGGNGGVNITGSPTHFANHIKFQDVQFASIKKLGVNIQTGANIEFDHCDWEQNGTTGDATTGNVRAAALSVLGEGVDLTFNNCWSEIVNGGFWLNLSGASGVTTFRDSMVWQVGGGTAPVGIINNGSKVLLTGSTKLQGFTTDIRTTNNGQTRVDGFATVGTHEETTGGTFKTNNASYI